MKLFSNILLLTGSKHNTSMFIQIVALINKKGADLKLMHIGQPTFDCQSMQLPRHRPPANSMVPSDGEKF